MLFNPNEKKKRRCLWMTDKDMALLRAIASRDETTVSQLVRQAIRYAFSNLWVPTKKEDYE